MNLDKKKHRIKTNNYDNGFFHQDLAKKRILALVPHEDDEINTCGSLIKILSICNAEVFVAYSTNGDWKFSAEIRIKEALAAAKVLGVRSENVFFLGYGDSMANNEHNHIFYACEKVTCSPAGHCETYGTNLSSDYSYLIREKHQPYTKNNFIDDIVSLIENISADLIICSDLDDHPDHRMLSLAFDQAIGIVRKRNPNYTPDVFKTFAYSLAYNAVADHSILNNPQTQKPTLGITDNYFVDLIDKSIYVWDARIRIPVVQYKGRVNKGIISKALLKHKSQHIISHADRIINSDEVYWSRRTDSISYNAKVIASSGNPSYLNDYMIINLEEVDSKAPKFADYCWKPDDADDKRIAQFSWKEDQNIEQIRLYSSIDEESKILELSISFSDGYSMIINEIPNNGRPMIIDTGKREGIKWCSLRIISYKGSNYGLSECEIYADKDKGIDMPYCKLMANDNFIYEYYIKRSIRKIKLSLYSHHCEDRLLHLYVRKGHSTIHDYEISIDRKDKDIIVECSDDNENVWDRIKIIRVSDLRLFIYRIETFLDISYIRKAKITKRIDRFIFRAKRDGIIKTIKVAIVKMGNIENNE